jgi:hypothetical protein
LTLGGVVLTVTVTGLWSSVRTAAVRQHAVSLSMLLANESLSTDQTRNYDSHTMAEQIAAAAWAVYPTPQAGLAMTTLLAEKPPPSPLNIGVGPELPMRPVPEPGVSAFTPTAPVTMSIGQGIYANPYRALCALAGPLAPLVESAGTRPALPHDLPRSVRSW